MSDTILDLEVLSVGLGDMKLTFNAGDEDAARKAIESMLRDGFQIFVETEKGPRRVKKFNPKRMTYVIVDGPVTAQKPTREVPVRRRARAIAATAGG